MRIEEEGLADTASTERKKGFFLALRAHLNFYRIHVLYFTFTPLIFSAIFYASNGDTHISYIDALFNCVSAICVCGLATVDLSSLTPWQQVILFIQMCIGNPIVVSWVVVFTRRRLFMQQCEEIVERARGAKPNSDSDAAANHHTHTRLFRKLLHREDTRQISIEERGRPRSPVKRQQTSKERSGGPRKVRADMIRRMDDAPMLVDPNGWISTSLTPTQNEKSPDHGAGMQSVSHPNASDDSGESPSHREHELISTKRLGSGPEDHPPQRDIARVMSSDHIPVPRTQTVEFAPEPHRPRRASVAVSMRRAPTLPEQSIYRLNSRSSSQGHGTIRRPSLHDESAYPPSFNAPDAQHRGFGFFPLPHQAIGRLLDKAFPGIKRRLARSVTMPRTQTIISQLGTQAAPGVRFVQYISFDAIVGRNSVFHQLTHEQLEELGGVEYRGLNALLWLIPLYTLGVLLIAFMVIAPYLSIVQQWRSVFLPPRQHKPVNPSWFTLFQIVSAFTNTGTSLVDQSMVPFQRAYPMIIFLSYLIFAGNTAYPVFFRFGIWLLTKVVPKHHSLVETLHFLLDHPRRCYIYLFPSPQTWFLLIVVVCLTLTDWVFFLVLDIGTEVIEALPVGIRIIDGLLQSAAVRSSGFAIVSIQSLAPAVRVAYVIMMYISVYPIAMSVRSTNVYENQSLGIYEDDHIPDDEEADLEAADLVAKDGQRMAVWGRHLTMHLRHQLSFDMWWLAFGLFLVCVIERRELTKSDRQFEIFTIIFELVSAYGGVGLSLGLPTANFSTSGGFRKLSKLVVCVVMLRGRHRGLPVAIDRAVVLPYEFKKDRELESHSIEMPRVSTMTSNNRGRAGSINHDVRRRLP